NSLSKLALMFPHVVAGFRRRKLRLQSGASSGNTMPSFEQVLSSRTLGHADVGGMGGGGVLKRKLVVPCVPVFNVDRDRRHAFSPRRPATAIVEPVLGIVPSFPRCYFFRVPLKTGADFGAPAAEESP
ncbi:MAG: hypothetical protein IJT88_07135, partial [Kiritimatiellae bacterium]|nr:hypothetical protein [Kiritimatiellia bacterium]